MSEPTTRTFWLLFADDEPPEGKGFLGVCVVDVTAGDAATAKQVIARRFPNAQPDAEWIAAAIRHAWAHGCNPGGEIATYDITGQAQAETVPRNRLLQKDELLALGLI